MTGRLDAVDLPTDLLLILMDRSDGPIELGHLYGLYHSVDPDPFAFDHRSDSADDYLEAVDMFREISFLELDGPPSRKAEASLTARGGVMAEILDDCLEDDQRQAIGEVGP